MARLPRAVLPGHVHVVVHRGRAAQPVFFDDEDRRRYADVLRAGLAETGVALHGYALDAAEVRLLVTPASAPGLAALMRFIGRRYVPAFNRRHGRGGTPWEGRFRSAPIEAPRCFCSCLRFVETGAGRGIAADNAATAWSSLAHHLGSRADLLLTEHPAFWTLGNTPFEREAAYRRYLSTAPPPGEVASILHAALHGWALGSPDFIAAVHAASGRRATPLPAGRPAHR